MKKFRNILSLILVLAMCMGLTANVFAGYDADGNWIDDEQEYYLDNGTQCAQHNYEPEWSFGSEDPKEATLRLVCSECHNYYTEETDSENASAKVWSVENGDISMDLVSEIEATCGQDGASVYAYSVTIQLENADPVEYTEKNAIYQYERPAHNYVFVENAEGYIPATCTNEGWALYECTVCHDSYWDVVAMTAHVPADEGVVTKEATTTEAGEVTYYCTICGGVAHTEAIDPVCDHVYESEIVKEATCGEEGITRYTCTICGNSYEEAIPCTPHQRVEGITTAPTCTEPGYITYHCDVCDQDVTEVDETRPALGHNVVDEIHPATCTMKGYTAHHCDREGCDYEEQATDFTFANGHNMDQGVVTLEPTCTEAGIMTYSCADCDFSYTREIPSQGGHKYDDGVVTVPATDYTEGVMTYTCQVCGDTYTEIIPMTSHVMVVSKVVEPTCTTQGYTVYTCEHGDGYTVTGNYVSALGHKWGEPTAWNWSEDYSAATATVVCEHDNSHVQVLNAVITSETREANAYVDGETVYTAIVTVGNNTYWDTKSVVIPATGPAPAPVRPVTPVAPVTNNDDQQIIDDEVPLVESPMLFADVEKNDWYYSAVAYVFNNGLMNGVTDTAFEPLAAASRGMVVTILYRLEGEPEAKLSSFSDVKSNAYYAKAIGWATDNGIVNGYDDGTFRPEQTITREQLAAILYRYAEFKGYDVSGKADLSEYADADAISDYAVEAVQWCVESGLINGVSSTKIAPNGSALRAQLATILERFCESVAE